MYSSSAPSAAASNSASSLLRRVWDLLWARVHPLAASPALGGLSGSRWARQRGLAAMLLLGLIGTLVCVGVTGAQVQLRAPDPRHMVVIDAGSSGSRVYLYTWRPGAAGELPIVEQMKSADGHVLVEKVRGMERRPPLAPHPLTFSSCTE